MSVYQLGVYQPLPIFGILPFINARSKMNETVYQLPVYQCDTPPSRQASRHLKSPEMLGFKALSTIFLLKTKKRINREERRAPGESFERLVDSRHPPSNSTTRYTAAGGE